MNDTLSHPVGNEAPNAHIRKYHDHLLDTDDYEQQTQLRLKKRVFDTFDQLLRFAGKPGLDSGGRVLDLGDADGTFASFCRARDLDATGLDITDGVNFETDFLPLDDASVEVITANSVIEHLNSPAIILHECRRVLRPGGVLILVTPNWRFSFKEFYDDPTHVQPYSPTSISELLAMYGFCNILVLPWIVKKPVWMWRVPGKFWLARLLPFRGNAPGWIPDFLKGQSKVMMALAVKPETDTLD